MMAPGEVGDVVGERFEILALAGVGGMGRVYRARDRESGHEVALKVLSSETLVDRERFAREVSARAHADCGAPSHAPRTAQESVIDRVARAALITADAGMGKSRIRHELVATAADFDVWIARGDTALDRGRRALEDAAQNMSAEQKEAYFGAIPVHAEILRRAR